MKRLRVLLILLLIVPATIAQDDDTTTISPALAEQIADIEQTTSELRGLTLTTPIERIFPTREEVLDFVRADMETQLTVDVAFVEAQFYRAFDFVDGPIDLGDVMAELIGTQAAGFYNPETNEMNVLLLSGETIEDSLPLLERITYAHEYVHALQDEAFDLQAYLEDINSMDNPDRALAMLSLVEGDATLVMQEYTLQDVMANPQDAMSLLDSDILAAAEIPPGTPFILEAELTMPYLTGMEFVALLRQEGGWEAVNAAFDNPPQSTEQIFHPEKYLAGEMPIEVSLTDDVSVLEGDNWSTLTERTFGEFYLRQYLGTQLARGIVNRAATGWGGDRFVLYHNDPNDERAWVMHLALDTPDDLTEFTDTFAQFAALRMNVEAQPAASGADCWTNDVQETLCALASSESSVYLSFAPSLADADALIAVQE